MKDEKQEEIDKYDIFQKEIIKENDFLIKIRDIFKLLYKENFQDILILQKQRFLEQLEKESLSILQQIYSDKIISNKKFNSLFKIIKEEFESKYNNNYDEISIEWDCFNNLKNENKSNNEEKINSYYISDFRRHCHNHEGVAIHKCGHAEKGKFIKIFLRHNFRFRNNKEAKYIICEECKKVFFKEIFNNYCSYCKENYLTSILSPNENKDCFIATYSEPHCYSFVNKAIPCKLCKENLHLFINDKKLKCLKCCYVIDLKNKNEFQWQCPNCNKYFKSNVKIFNSSENLVLPNILKKAFLLRNKAHPYNLKCCNIDINDNTFFHNKECNGIIYLCNVENIFFNNKKWVIVCDKCESIYDYKNFSWTCPKCGKLTLNNNENEENLITPPKLNNNKNKVEEENTSNYNAFKSNLYRKYLSNHILKKPSLSPCTNDDNNKRKRNDESNNKNIQKFEEKKNDENLYNSENKKIKVNVRVNEKTNSLKESNLIFYRRARKYNSQRINQIVINTNNTTNTDNNDILTTINKYKSSREKYKYKKKLDVKEEQNKNNLNNNNEKKKIENKIPIPTPRANFKQRNAIPIRTEKNEEKNKMENKFKINKIESFKSNNNLEEKEKKINDSFNRDSFHQNNNGDNQNIINLNKKSDSNYNFNFRYKRNIPVRLKYINENNNICININKQSLKKSLEIENANNKLKEELNKNKEEYTDRNKRYILYSVEDRNFNRDGRISKENTAQGSKASFESSSKQGSNNSNNNFNSKKSDNSNLSNNSKDKDYFYLSSNFNFRNIRKFYIKEREKESDKKNVKNLKNNIPIPGFSSRFKNHKTNLELNDIDFNVDVDEVYNIKKDVNNKPSDIKEPSEINYSEDIEIYDKKIKRNKELYNNIQNGIKKILEKGRLPQFNIDNYTIEKKIGDGAFGVLFSVYNNKTKKKYAMKKLTASDLKLLEDLQREFEIVYKSNHDNILNIYGICIRVYDSTTFALFVLMDLGERDWEVEINKRFKEKNYYSEQQLINILKQLTSALVYLQKREIAHRDIKPENIILFNENESADEITYKICDFGEAKEKIKVNSRHKSIRGTDYYMSPILFKGLTQEQKFVKDNAYKSDVFSLGICMIIACILDFNFINKIRNIEEQSKMDKIVRENLEKRYSNKFIQVLLKMVVFYEKDRIDFFGLEKLINTEL